MSIQAIEQDNRWTPPNDRGNSVVKNTHELQGSTDKQVQRDVLPIEDTQELITAEEQKFISLVAQGISLTSAYRQAYPNKSKLSYETIRAYASRLYAKDNISTLVEVKQATLARLARLAEDRIEDTLVNGATGSKAVTDTSMFMYEQANGKALVKQEIISKKVSVVIDLTGQLQPEQA